MVRPAADGAHFFVQARSMVMDQDLDFSNDYEHVSAWDKRGQESQVGRALWGIPFLVLARMVHWLMGLVSLTSPGDLDATLLVAFDWASYVFGTLTLLVLYRTTCSYFPRGVSLLSVLTLGSSSFFGWYVVVEPSMPHAVSAGLTAGMLGYWLQHRPFIRTRDFLVVGLLAGLSATVRYQNGVLLLLPLLDHFPRTRAGWKQIGLAVVASVVCWTPQLAFLLWNRVDPTQMPGVRFSKLQVAEVLFSTDRGLFPWSPVVYVGVVGLAAWLRRSPRLAALFVLGFAAEVYINGTVRDYGGGWAFGGRRFDGCLLLFALGLAAVLQWMLRRPLVLVTTLCAGLVLWNLGLAKQSKHGDVPPTGLISFRRVATENVGAAYDLAGLPFAFPANAIFAWRYRVSPERFDRLWGHQGYGDVDLTFDGGAEFALADGWSQLETDRAGTSFRWVQGREARLLLPLKAARHGARVSFRLRPAPGTLPNRATLIANGRTVGAQALTDDQVLAWLVPPSAWRTGINELVLFFDRNVRPADVMRSSDTRLLSAAAYTLRLERLSPE